MNRRRIMEIALSNARAAIDQADCYEDSISAYATNVRDTLADEGLTEYLREALKEYYERISELL